VDAFGTEILEDPTNRNSSIVRKKLGAVIFGKDEGEVQRREVVQMTSKRNRTGLKSKHRGMKIAYDWESGGRGRGQ
tara:strand:- start:3195 stop:3422 length:228 start_codon:yes stop_codon:yes gene_type:complete